MLIHTSRTTLCQQKVMAIDVTQAVQDELHHVGHWSNGILVKLSGLSLTVVQVKERVAICVL